mgnify:FL=1
MGFLDKLWKGWGKSESTLPTKEKKAPVIKKKKKKTTKKKK